MAFVLQFVKILSLVLLAAPFGPEEDRADRAPASEACDEICQQLQAVPDTVVVSRITRALQSPGFEQEFPRLAGVDDRIVRFYEAHGFQPQWIVGTRVSEHADALLQDIRSADQDGLHSEAFRPDRVRRALDRLAQSDSVSAIVDAELELTRAFFQYASTMLTGRVDPQELSSEVYLQPETLRVDSILTALLSAKSDPGFRESLVPRHSHYERLVAALGHYRALEAKGGWAPIPDGETLEPGDEDARVPALRQRLSVTGDLSQVSDLAVTGLPRADWKFDVSVQQALAHFQQRHGLAVDSTLGPATLAALNVSASQRARQIELSLERLRWLPQDPGERYVMVNIPEFRVRGFDRSGPTVDMRVVVGADYGGHQTPVFQENMDHVVINPYWNVPYSIASEEIAPSVRANSNYLASRNFEGVGGSGKVIPASSISAQDIIDGRLRIRQKPGAGNALGLIKFMFPNPHAIYLHDTPADHLFSEPERAFSHGCIRLEDPPGFGEWVLRAQGWDRSRIEQEMGNPERTRVDLDEDIPVYIIYLTAFADEEGVHFRDDIYGNDAVLDQALSKLEEASSR
ncbi:MAG: L,D-transpeptidase family protein [Rhodothermales bacterium]|nr:L,D-transpeptidase family protein [Rhodothermales bacterium]